MDFAVDAGVMSHLFNTYARMPVRAVRGEGAWLFDEQGRRYLDAVSGIAVCSLGHAHPRVAEAIAEQARTLVHTANIVEVPLQERLGEELARISGLDRAFIANSGAEAIECALKIARLHARQRGIERPAVLVAEHAFHGRTLAALSASGNAAIQAGFEPLVDGFVRVPFDDLEAAEAAFEAHPDLVAALIEPVQGEGGVRVPADDYLPGLRRLCDAHDALLIFDEIQCGMNRTGRWFAYQHQADLRPDVLTIAKALGNGVPIGACLACETAAELMRPGSHGTTFGGNPLACRAGLEVIDIMRDEAIGERAAAVGRRMLDHLRAALDDVAAVTDIRGRGLMIGIELDRDCAELKDDALARGVMINVTRGRIVRLLPPLTISDEEADRITRVVVGCIEARFGR
jgi:acetylornithine aminotransferase